MLFSNFASTALLPNTLEEISAQWPIRVDPAVWAFAIWALIYLLIGIFAVYQALPDSCVPDRNNDLIFN